MKSEALGLAMKRDARNRLALSALAALFPFTCSCDSRAVSPVSQGVDNAVAQLADRGVKVTDVSSGSTRAFVVDGGFSKCTDDDIPLVANLENVELLLLHHSQSEVTVRGIQHLRALRHLGGIRGRFSAVSSPTALAVLRDVPGLRLLTLGGAIYDESVAELAKFPALEVLEISSNDLSEEAVLKLASIETLRELSLPILPIAGSGLSSLAGLPNLRKLEIRCDALRPEDLAVLAELPTLQDLTLYEPLRDCA